MNLMQSIIKICGGYTIDEYNKAKSFNNWKDEYDEACDDLVEFKKINNNLNELIAELRLDKNISEDLLNKLAKLNPLTTEARELIKFYDDKYPSKSITYGGTLIKTNKLGNFKPRIKVCDFVTCTQSMKDWIISKNLTYKGTGTVTSYSKHMWKIYSEFTKNTKYMTDSTLYGESEKWQPNILQMYIKDGSKWLGDCENMTLLCMGLFMAAGIPRGLYRNVCGTTKLGGHSCLFAFDWRTKNWQQWETTATSPRIVGVDEKIYISQVWFSFDSEKSWSTKPKLTYTKTIS